MNDVVMSGAGNTFLMLDGREMPDGADLSSLARERCPSIGGGVDGLIAVVPRTDVDFEMRYYNRDGSTGMMCGNGGRCAVRYAVDLGVAPDPYSVTLENAGVEYRGAITERGVRLWFPDPREFRLGFGIVLDGDQRICHYADVGTPHAVLFVDEALTGAAQHVADIDIDRLGPALRSHERFGDEGANANFVEVVPGRSEIRLRTFERGVEGETGACGTGSISSAIIAALLRGLTPPVEVSTTSGEKLWVGFRASGDHITDVWLEGPAEYVGRVEG